MACLCRSAHHHRRLKPDSAIVLHPSHFHAVERIEVLAELWVKFMSLLSRQGGNLQRGEETVEPICGQRSELIRWWNCLQWRGGCCCVRRLHQNPGLRLTVLQNCSCRGCRSCSRRGTDIIAREEKVFELWPSHWRRCSKRCSARSRRTVEIFRRKARWCPEGIGPFTKSLSTSHTFDLNRGSISKAAAANVGPGDGMTATLFAEDINDLANGV
mmetsp:Transcript_89746/g.159532  ORF Transcript_89746/g.159532 Transcript_89746/m.159532 type:complete len:214 (-) Transcript_89746:469-1110(-)